MQSNQKIGNQLLNTVFFNKYRLVEKLGEGTFGMIFKCESSDGLCAFKFEKKRPNKRSLLKDESDIMISLKGPGIPKIYNYIEEGDYNIMIMELLGKSLEGLLKKSPEKKLSLKTCCLLGIEMIKILKSIHDKHFIHRDIKPDNFAIGYSNPKNLYLLDFGLAKKYRSSKTLEQKPMMKNKKLTGTARYASINALKGYDQSRRDDLESVGYVLAYLLRGSLPWQGIIVKTKEEKYAKILYKKQYITPEQLFNGYPSDLINYIKYCKYLEYEQEPNYNYLTNLFINVIKNELKEEIDYKYDWIKNDIDLQKSITENYITEDGINDNYLNNSSIVNNTNNSLSNIKNNSSIINEKNKENENSIDCKNEIKDNKIDNNIKNNNNKENNEVNYYDQVLGENCLGKKYNDNIDKDEDEEEDEDYKRKRKHAPCCISF
jgi:serine/threonine protein kinase